MDPCKNQNRQLVLAANAISVALSKNLSANEENILGNLLTLIGASLLSLAALDESCGTKSSTGSQNSANSPH